MKRVHDMGGNAAGPVRTDERDLPVFKKPWHARALAITVAAGALRVWNLDASRNARECLDQNEYRRFSYYEKWLAALANQLVAHGLATTDELERPHCCPIAQVDNRALRGQHVRKVVSTGSPAKRNIKRPSGLKVGQLVRTRTTAGNRLFPGGHTRLPAYAQDSVGRVVRDHGAHVFPDSNAHFLGEAPEPLYSVAFEAVELWGSDAENAEDEVVLDLWESYLTPV